MSACQACGVELTSGAVRVGGAVLCRPCAADIEEEVALLRSAGKPVSVIGIARRRYRELNNTQDAYILRDIPADIMRALKLLALNDGVSVRDVILASVRQYINQQRGER